MAAKRYNELMNGFGLRENLRALISTPVQSRRLPTSSIILAQRLYGIVTVM